MWGRGRERQRAGAREPQRERWRAREAHLINSRHVENAETQRKPKILFLLLHRSLLFFLLSPFCTFSLLLLATPPSRTHYHSHLSHFFPRTSAVCTLFTCWGYWFSACTLRQWDFPSRNRAFEPANFSNKSNCNPCSALVAKTLSNVAIVLIWETLIFQLHSLEIIHLNPNILPLTSDTRPHCGDFFFSLFYLGPL